MVVVVVAVAAVIVVVADDTATLLGSSVSKLVALNEKGADNCIEEAEFI